VLFTRRGIDPVDSNKFPTGNLKDSQIRSLLGCLNRGLLSDNRSVNRKGSENAFLYFLPPGKNSSMPYLRKCGGSDDLI
jgi:hypothetical protein